MKATLISPVQLMEWQKQDVFDRFDRLVPRVSVQNRAFTMEDVQADVAEAIVEVRAI